MASFTVNSALPYVGDIFGANNFPHEVLQGIVTASQTVSQAGAATVTTLLAGSVVSIKTSGSTLSLVQSGNSDGTQTAVGVLAQNVETASTTSPVAYYVTGSFDKNALLFGGSDTYATHKTTLNSLNIYGEQSYTYAAGAYNS
jgi:hypothetical protein